MQAVLCTFLLLAATCTAVRLRRSRRTLPSEYHTSDEIHAKIADLGKSCKTDLDVQTVDGIDIVTMGPSNATTKAFILFGEHSRELVSPETALLLINRICQGESRNISFTIMPNANPRGRRLVEQGDTCRRTNPEGIDINRNWEDSLPVDKNEVNKQMEEQTYGGDHAFSTVETRTIRDAVSEFKPDLFISIHSGTFGMYTPYASDQHPYESEKEKQDFDRMAKLVRKVDDETCNCPLGEAVVKVGYSSWGTCIDWVYKNLKTPYVYAFEIFTSQDAMDGSCFSHFNPDGQSLNKVTSKWASAILKVAELAHQASILQS